MQSKLSILFALRPPEATAGSANTQTGGLGCAEAHVARWRRPRRGLLLVLLGGLTRRVLAIGSLLLFALLFNSGEVLADWTKYDNNAPVDSDGASTNGKIPLGSSGKGDDGNIISACVIKDGSTYKLWYGGSDGTTTRIYYATSSNGLEWTKYDNTIPVDSDGSSTNGKIPTGTSGKGDDFSVAYPFVIKDGSTYKMWYAGSDGANYRLYYATSSNGLEWAKYDNNVPVASDGSSTNGKIPLGTNTKGDDAIVLGTSVLKDDSTYKMWYVGNDGTSYRIYYATSSNGLEWTKYDNNTPANSDGACTNGKIPLGSSGKGDDNTILRGSVLKDNTTYKMWYVGRTVGTTDRVYYATSPNGVAWTKFDNTIPPNSDTTNSNNRVGLGTSGKGDDLRASIPFVFKDAAPDTFKMWYTGNDGVNWRIYYATAPVPPPAGTFYYLK